jgi:hypothetical protein
LLLSRLFKALRGVEQNQPIEIETTREAVMPTRTPGVTSELQPPSTEHCVSNSGTHKKVGGSQSKHLIMAAAQKVASQGDGWFLAADLEIDPDKGQPLSRRVRDWALAELVGQELLEQGTPLRSGKRGKPAMRYRVTGKFSGVAASDGRSS